MVPSIKPLQNKKPVYGLLPTYPHISYLMDMSIFLYYML
jgi:hypothetical protein